MIDKSKLMKRAWEIAEHGFLNSCIDEYCGKTNARPQHQRNLKNYSLREKRNFIEAPHIQKTLNMNFTKKSFFVESLRLSWIESKKQAKRDLETALEIIKTERAVTNEAKKLEKIADANKNAPRRRLVAADKYSEGDKLGNFIVTGLGRTFRPNTDMFSLGITPDTDYVQYAYFN